MRHLLIKLRMEEETELPLEKVVQFSSRLLEHSTLFTGDLDRTLMLGNEESGYGSTMTMMWFPPHKLTM